MAGKIIADIIEAPYDRITLNVGNVTVASINSSGVYSNTGNLLVNNSGSIGAGAIANGAITRPKMGYAGAVLQVVQAKLSSSFSTTSTSATDIGLSASITPTSSSSRILCFVTLNGVRNSGTTYNTYLYLDRNGTKLDSVGLDSSFFTYYAATQLNGRVGTVSNMILDTPSTTSALTYKVQMAVENSASTSFINNQNTMLSVSTLVLMEIAGWDTKQ